MPEAKVESNNESEAGWLPVPVENKDPVENQDQYQVEQPMWSAMEGSQGAGFVDSINTISGLVDNSTFPNLHSVRIDGEVVTVSMSVSSWITFCEWVDRPELARADYDATLRI